MGLPQILHAECRLNAVSETAVVIRDDSIQRLPRECLQTTSASPRTSGFAFPAGLIPPSDRPARRPSLETQRSLETHPPSHRGQRVDLKAMRRLLPDARVASP